MYKRLSVVEYFTFKIFTIASKNVDDSVREMENYVE